MADFKSILSWIFGLLLLIYGLIPLLNSFGILAIKIPSFIFILKLWVILGASVWLAVDAFMEEHFIKTITMIVALIMLLMVAVPLLYSAGLLPFTLPGFIFALENYVYSLAGILLLIGPIFYN